MRQRIGLVVVGEESSIGEMLETGGVISHDVLRAWEVPGLVAIAVRALVHGGNQAKLSSRTVSGDGAFVNAGLGGSVVREVAQGGVSGIMLRAHEAHLCDEATVLQVTVGDAAVGVVGADHLILDVLGERKPP